MLNITVDFRLNNDNKTCWSFCHAMVSEGSEGSQLIATIIISSTIAWNDTNYKTERFL